VSVHRKNHPRTKHECQDLQLCDWTQVPDHEILLASPCCQGHSNAKGVTKDWSENSRSTAWCVFSAMSKKRPLAAVVENVPEFTRWTESDDPAHAGSVYRAWRGLIETIGPGYHYSDIVIDAADLGVPQHRRRLFMVFTRKDAAGPVITPCPKSPHRPFKDVMEDGTCQWARVSEKAETTRRFVERSSALYPGQPFLVPYYGATLERGVGRSVDRPLGTITTRARYALVDCSHAWLRMLTASEYRSCMGFGREYILPAGLNDSIRMLGNAVVPDVAAYVLGHVMKAVA
jgi:DNA (cytosine-5)-methyltransferase 1